MLARLDVTGSRGPHPAQYGRYRPRSQSSRSCRAPYCALRATGYGLIHTQGIGDLYRIYLTTQRDGVDFNLAYISDSFNAPHMEEFDTEFMRQLYAVGYDMAAKGYPWQKTPPGFAATTGADK